MAEVVINIKEIEHGYNISAIWSEEKEDSEVLKKLTELLSYVMLDAAKNKISEVLENISEVKNG